MKVLTLNTWQERGLWAQRWEIILEGIRRLGPDIACFQELFNESWAGEVLKRSRFKSMLYQDDKCGNALYTNYSVKEWGVVTLTKSPIEEYLRYAVWGKLDVDGLPLFVFNTHLSWMLEDGAIRQKQVEEILALIEKKNPEGESLLMGDLNAPPDSAEIKYLIQKGNFRDLFEEARPGDERITWDNRNPYAADAVHPLPDRRIDYILARGKGALLKNLVVCDLIFTQPNAGGVRASDHYGVTAEFKTKGGI